MESFDEFIEEYVYVILASGFRAELAARLAPAVHAACAHSGGDATAMRAVFANGAKITAIADTWQRRAGM